MGLRIFANCLAWAIWVAYAVASAAVPGNSLIQQAIRAESAGDFKHAYLLWAQAAVKYPALWAKAKKLEAFVFDGALAHAGRRSATTTPSAAANEDEEADNEEPAGLITSRDLDEARRFGEPARLKPFVGTRSLHFRGDVKSLYERVSQEFGYQFILDRDLQNAPPTQLRFDIDDATYDTALHILEAATNTFIVPISGSSFLAAQDTTQKRNELEPSAVQLFLIPERSSVQEAQEILTAVQQALEIRRAVLDPGKRLILMRGPYSRIQVAGALLRQLVGFKPQVSIEVELITFAANKSRSWGLGLQTSSNLINFGKLLSNVVWSNTSTISNLLGFGGGATFLGIGLTGANLFAHATEGESRSLMRSQVVVVDGQPATVHIGDKYPIVTSQFSGTAGLGAYPSFNFEDLGLVMKVTPAIHTAEEVTLDIEAEFKAINGTGANGIPIIGDKKLQSKVRINTSDWVVVSGLLTRTDADTISGLPGLSRLPVVGTLFRDTTRSTDFSEALILIKANILSSTPSDKVSSPVWVGSDTRWRTVL